MCAGNYMCLFRQDVIFLVLRSGRGKTAKGVLWIYFLEAKIPLMCDAARDHARFGHARKGASQSPNYKRASILNA